MLLAPAIPSSAGEALDGQNKYKCPKQQKAVGAIKRMTVDLAPNVLMIQLKRFEFSMSGHKISKKVGVWVGCWLAGFSWVGGWVASLLPCCSLLSAFRVPLCLVAPLLHVFTPSIPSAAPLSQIDFDLELDLAPYMSVRPRGAVPYDLYAVLVHSGHSVHSGHYYAYVRAPNGIWHICDDTNVAQVGACGGWPWPACLTYALWQAACMCSPHAELGTAPTGWARTACLFLIPPWFVSLQVAERQVMAQKAYILFYLKRQAGARAPPPTSSRGASASPGTAAATAAAVAAASQVASHGPSPAAAPQPQPQRRQDVQQQAARQEGGGGSLQQRTAGAAADGNGGSKKRKQREAAAAAAVNGAAASPGQPASGGEQQHQQRRLKQQQNQDLQHQDHQQQQPQQNGRISKRPRLQALKQHLAAGGGGSSDDDAPPLASPLPRLVASWLPSLSSSALLCRHVYACLLACAYTHTTHTLQYAQCH
jgi:hypothetical protein